MKRFLVLLMLLLCILGAVYAAKENAKSIPMLVDGSLIKLKDLPLNPFFKTSIAVKQDIDLKFEEEKKNAVWTVLKYNHKMLRVELEHDRAGFFPFSYDVAEIEIEAVERGKSTIELGYMPVNGNPMLRKMVIEIEVL